MMPYYIAAFRADHSRVLGNLDGQACIRARRPERTRAWLELGKAIRASTSIAYWVLEDERGNEILRKPNPHHQERR